MPPIDPEFSSPACSMHEVSDTYMGYAAKEEIVPFLNELLEAERAGARVTLESARGPGGSAFAGLLDPIHRDEARWAAMLQRHLRALAETPSRATGVFHGKAMAIADLHRRIVFLNKGQAWVVRRIRDMLPRIRDDRLHADLTAMLRSHEINIELTNEFLA